jgi:hypothetical protein
MAGTSVRTLVAECVNALPRKALQQRDFTDTYPDDVTYNIAKYHDAPDEILSAVPMSHIPTFRAGLLARRDFVLPIWASCALYTAIDCKDYLLVANLVELDLPETSIYAAIRTTSHDASAHGLLHFLIRRFFHRIDANILHGLVGDMRCCQRTFKRTKREREREMRRL